MSDVEEVPESFAEAIEELAQTLYRAGVPLTPSMLTHLWVAGLVAARLGAEHVTVKEWKPGKRWPEFRNLPYVLKFPCPGDHRTEDRRDDPWVSIIIEENGWFSLDPQSECTKCTAQSIRDWLLTCPRCEKGEDSERHDPLHWALDVFDIDGGYDASPLAWIMLEFGREARRALARWWLDHTEEALDSDPIASRSTENRERLRVSQVAWAQRVIESQPKRKPSKAKLDAAGAAVMTVEEAAAWLDAEGVPATASQRAALALTEGRPGRPSKPVIEKAVTLRKSRATQA